MTKTNCLWVMIVLLMLVGCSPPSTPAPTATSTASAINTATPRTSAVSQATVTLTATGAADVILTAASSTAKPSGAATTSPAAAPTSPPQSGTPVILSFTVSATEVEAGGDVTFTWTSTGGASAYIYENFQNGYGKRGFAVPPSGSLTITTDSDDRHTHSFSLHVYQNADPAEAGPYASADVKVTFVCHVAAFYPIPPGMCPDATANDKQAADQVFEHGRMVWLQYWSGSSSAILVLQASGVYSVFTDNWQSGDLESDPSLVPPNGMIQPVRGFGKVWRDAAGVRSSLGWAVTSEQGYVTPFQVASNAGESGGGYQYLKLSDGRAIVLWPMFHWEYIGP